MAVSPLDSVVIEAYGVPGRSAQVNFNFADWTSLELTNSITEPSECSFEMGDDTGWDRLENLLGLGGAFRVFVNDRLRLTGRIEALDSPSDALQSTTQRFIVRTKLSDARYNSAPQGMRLRNVSIKRFLLALYSDIGLTEADFDFRGDVARDLLTGRRTKRGRPPKDLEKLTEDQAKVNPPETIFDAADRHLRRHGLIHWDSPDGKIVVAAPDDTQAPVGFLRSFRGREGQFNNVLAAHRAQDVSQSPTVLGMFGRGGKRGFSKHSISSVLINQNLIAKGFDRKIILNDEGLRTREQANRRAAREFASRNRSLERLSITVDGLSYRDGSDLLPWAPDTTVDVVLESQGGYLGLYYVERVTMTRNASDSDRSQLTLVPQGVWVL